MATGKLDPAHENATAAAAAADDDDCIDMDISSATLFCYATNTKCSPPHPHSIEFEFQMSSNPLQRGAEETTPSPADELFYKGKLLPLHLPPRMEMVEDLLHNSTAMFHHDCANISVASSCYVSGELNPEEEEEEEEEDYHSREFSGSRKKKSWSEKLMSSMSRQSNLGRTVLKASRAYIKSLFTKSDQSSTSSSKPKACSSGRLNPTTLLKSIQRGRLAEEELLHRKSFSGAINWHSTTKSSSNAMTPTSCSSSSSSSSSSSFSSVNSGGFYGPLVLKRSSSVNSEEVESPIEGAIAHCKKSQQPARKSVSDITLTASNIVAACENKERPGLCRG